MYMISLMGNGTRARCGRATAGRIRQIFRRFVYRDRQFQAGSLGFCCAVLLSLLWGMLVSATAHAQTNRVDDRVGTEAAPDRADSNQTDDSVQISLVAEVRDDSLVVGGQRVARLVPAAVLHEGQEVFYTVRILNPGSAPARDVEVVQRVPQNTIYVPRSASGPGAEVSFSADGGVTFGREGQLTVTDPTSLASPMPRASATPGASNQSVVAQRRALSRPATPEDYTHIRWRLRNPLAPGAVALARFRAKFR